MMWSKLQKALGWMASSELLIRSTNDYYSTSGSNINYELNFLQLSYSLLLWEPMPTQQQIHFGRHISIFFEKNFLKIKTQMFRLVCERDECDLYIACEWVWCKCVR